MAKEQPAVLSRDGKLGSFPLFQPVSDGDSLPSDATQPILLPPDAWTTAITAGRSLDKTALCISGDTEPQAWTALLAEAHPPKVIGIDFSPFADGRGFSLAQQLRRRWKYKDILIATGGFLPDQASYLFRCGFDRLQFDSTERAAQAQKLLHPFETTYQAVLHTRVS